MSHSEKTTAEIQAAANRAAPDPVTDPHYARRWWILALLGIAQLMVVLDSRFPSAIM